MAMVSDDILLAQGLFRLLLSPAGEGHDRGPAHRRRILKVEREAVFNVLCSRVDLLQDLFSGALASSGSASPSRVDPQAGASDIGTAPTT